jgi:hypothetical protein
VTFHRGAATSPPAISLYRIQASAPDRVRATTFKEQVEHIINIVHLQAAESILHDNSVSDTDF